MTTAAIPFTSEQLWQAWERVQENAGCAGADGVTVAHFGHRAGKAIPTLFERVATGQYRPFPLLKIVVEKKAGKNETRTLLVPAVGDRVLQTAVARYLSRSFEEEFLECSYGYRPGRSVDRAIARIRKCHELGYRFVLDTDIESYFDRVDHRILLAKLGERRLGATVQALLRQWVKGSYWDGQKIHGLHRGLPQGSPISPLLANFYLEDFDREMEKDGRKLVRYADDFLILSKTAEESQRAMLATETLLAAAHLKLRAEKTQITDFEHGFRFLGALFEGDATWVPWKYAHRKGRVLFMAPPLPVRMRTRFELAPPRSAMEAALTRMEIHAPVSRAEGGSDVAFLYLTEQGSILRKAGDRLLVEKEDEILLDLPYHKLETVLMFGGVQVTSQAMGELLEKGVGLSLFSRQGVYRGSLEPPRGKNIELRIAQFEAARDFGRALGMARRIVAAKVANGAAVLAHLRRNAGEGGDDFPARLAHMAEAETQTEAAADIATLDGVEGAAARAYFELLMRFNRSEVEWPGRVKHPATDPMNALLSLAYTLIMNELAALLQGLGLDPYLGFLHQVDYGRPSLALDVMEPFRHPVADRLVLNLFNQRVLDGADFHTGGEGHGVFLSPKPMRRFFADYEAWMLEKPEAGVCFRELLRQEAQKLAVALREGGAYEPWRYGGANCST